MECCLGLLPFLSLSLSFSFSLGPSPSPSTPGSVAPMRVGILSHTDGCSWDTGLIGGVLTMKGFQHSFNLDPKSSTYANLSGNIVSILQGGCFFGAAASFWLSDKM